MRKIIVSSFITLDGVMLDPSGLESYCYRKKGRTQIQAI